MTILRRLGAAIFVILATGLLCGVGEAHAQQAGRLSVKVVDQTGSVLPGATVELQGGNASTTPAVTDATGVRAVEGLVAGRYAVTVTADGFAPAKKPVEIRANRLTEVTVVLFVRLEEAVEVPGLRIGTPNSLTGMIFSGRALSQLPNGEIELLARLQDLAGTRGRPGDVAIYVDGFRDFRRLPPKAAIELIQINADPYSAEYAEPGTRRIEIITKPGADGMFGEIKSDFNDESLNAREPLATSKPSLQRRTLSGYYSAPIVPQKWGFYGYAGRWEEDEHAIVNATTLDDALQATSFLQTLAAPNRTNTLTLNTGYALGAGSRLKAEYSRDALWGTNQGLESGRDLPERGFTTDTVTHSARFSLLSVMGASAVYELRVQFKKQTSRVRAMSGDTGIMVLDAFNSGANQDVLYKDDLNDALQIDTKLTRSVGKHTMKMGLQLDAIELSQVNFDNFGGTFVFGADVERDANGLPVLDATGATIPISPLESYRRTLLELPGYRPTLFTITTGDPASQVRQLQGGAYFQDEWIPSQNFNMSFGLRYEGQAHLARRFDPAPRVGLSWKVGGNGGLVRAGSGVFYKRFDPSLTLNTFRLDGQRQHQFVVARPSFNPPPELDQKTERQTIMEKADGLSAGRLLVTNAGYERAFFGPLSGSATYTWERGDRLTRLTDVNTPVTPGGSRPIAGSGEVLQYQSVGRSSRHELQVGIRADFSKGSRLLLNYTLASTKSDTDGPQALPSDSRALGNEWGPAPGDERHRVFLTGTLMLPRFWMLIPSFTYGTPRPFNIITGLDNNLDGHITDRPSFAEPGDALVVQTPWGLLNPLPKPGQTIIPRNFGRGDRTLKADLSLAKVFMLDRLADSKRTIAVHLTAQNILNTTTFRTYNRVLLSPLFGQAITADLARRVSIGVGFNF